MLFSAVNKTREGEPHTWTVPAGREFLLKKRNDRLQLRDLRVALVAAIADASDHEDKVQQRHDADKHGWCCHHLQRHEKEFRASARGHVQKMARDGSRENTAPHPCDTQQKTLRHPYKKKTASDTHADTRREALTQTHTDRSTHATTRETSLWRQACGDGHAATGAHTGARSITRIVKITVSLHVCSVFRCLYKVEWDMKRG